MTTTKEAFDTFLTGQQKMMEWWTDNSRKMMDTFSQSTHQTTKGSEFLNDWFEQQKSLFEEAGKITDPKEAFEKAPDQFKKWVDLQVKFSENWMKAYKEGAEKLGMKMPDLNGYSPERMFEKTMMTWVDNMQQGNDWLKQNILDKLPPAMQPHYKDFNRMYEDLFRYWDPFRQMMKFGVYDIGAIDNFFSQSQYQDIINKLFGFKMSGDAGKWVEQANAMFEQYQEFLKKSMPSAEKWEENWQAYFKNFNGNAPAPFFQASLDMNQRLKDNIEPFLNILGYGKEAQLTRVLKDIQFAYTAFLLRSAEMQNLVYQSGQSAMPDTIRSFHESYKEGKELPDFETFFQRYIDTLEKEVTEVLESKSYSVLQAEVSKLGVTVKGKLDELIELSFNETPFLMKSDGDDLAKEAHTLRRKVRDMEKRLKDLESKLERNNTVPKNGTKKAAAAK